MVECSSRSRKQESSRSRSSSRHTTLYQAPKCRRQPLEQPGDERLVRHYVGRRHPGLEDCPAGDPRPGLDVTAHVDALLGAKDVAIEAGF